MAIRSGRFRVKTTTTSPEFTIIKGRDKALYRIFNSGEKSFKVKPQGPSTPDNKQVRLDPTLSVDVAVDGGNGEVLITAVTPGDEVEGIYDYLDAQNPELRSGRFSSTKHLDPTTGATADPSTPHKIIVFSGGSVTAWYRIFNSGENKIILTGGPSSSGEIEEAQSLDFAAGAASSTITVQSGGAGLHIEGIYEFLGKS